MRIFGCTVSDKDARMLVAVLTRSDDADAADAAIQISLGLGEGGSAGSLSPPMCDAILSVLKEKPLRGLEPLRIALAKDQRARL